MQLLNHRRWRGDGALLTQTRFPLALLVGISLARGISSLARRFASIRTCGNAREWRAGRDPRCSGSLRRRLAATQHTRCRGNLATYLALGGGVALVAPVCSDVGEYRRKRRSGGLVFVVGVSAGALRVVTRGHPAPVTL